jgi:hypothetical protein
MRVLLTAVIVAGLLTSAIPAFAQSTTHLHRLLPRFCAAGSGWQTTGMSKLCRAQARLDCLRQAIDQKVIGPQSWGLSTSDDNYQRMSVSVVAPPRNHFCYKSLTVPV